MRMPFFQNGRKYCSDEGKEFLIGHNERYVKIGVLASEAAEKGYGENEIHEVFVEHVLV